MSRTESERQLSRQQRRGRHAESESSDTPTSCPLSLEGQMLPSSQPDLCSEGGREEGRRKGQQGGGGLRDPSLTLAHVSPPESHPAELGDFQRQFLLTSQLSWASGLLIRLVNTTRTSRGRGKDPSRAPQSPSSTQPPSPGLLSSGREHLSSLLLLPFPGQGLCVSRSVSLAVCLCLAPL